MRVLLIDQDPFFRAMVRKYHERDLPEIDLTELDPNASSFSQTAMDWTQFEVLLLSHGDNASIGWVVSLEPRPVSPSCISPKPAPRSWPHALGVLALSSRVSGWRRSLLRPWPHPRMSSMTRPTPRGGRDRRRGSMATKWRAKSARERCRGYSSPSVSPIVSQWC